MTFLRLLKWELVKIARRRASYVAFVLIAVFCALVMLGFGFSRFRGMQKYAALLNDNPLSYVNGYFYANFCLNIAFFTLLPLFATVVPGSQIAGEASAGTLRLIMTRPPSRPSVFLAKAFVSYVWLQLIILFLIAFSVVFGVIVLRGGDFLVYIWEFRKAGLWVVDSGEVVWIFLGAGFGAGVSLFMISSVALLLSTVTDSPVAAHVGTLGAFFISSIIQRLPDDLMAPGFKAAMPTTHMNFWHEPYRLFHPDPGVFDAARFWSDLAWCGGYSVLFLTIGMVVFSRRDITR
jgi:ABC-2 type transport system permease protein